MIINGPYVIICGPYVIIYGPYMIIYEPYMIIYGPYMLIYCSRIKVCFIFSKAKKKTSANTLIDSEVGV